MKVQVMKVQAERNKAVKKKIKQQDDAREENNSRITANGQQSF